MDFAYSLQLNAAFLFIFFFFYRLSQHGSPLAVQLGNPFIRVELRKLSRHGLGLPWSDTLKL